MVKPLDRKRTIVIVVRWIASVVLVVSVAWYAVLEYQYAKAAQDTKKVVDSIPTVPIDDLFHPTDPAAIATPFTEEPYETITATDVKLTSDGVLPVYVALYRQNPDFAGWIRLPGWKKYPIDYPVMFSGDNDFYLRRDFYKQKSIAGSIFIDGTNDPRSLDRNLVLYGHAMRALTMFGHLEDYPENENSWKKRNLIYVDLLWTRLEYEVFSTYYIEDTGDYRRTSFQSDEDFGAYAALLASRSVYDFGVEVGKFDRILTLSTCQRDFENRRVAIHARLVRRIVYERGPYSSAEITGVPTGPAIPTNLPTITPTPLPVTPEPSMEATPSPEPSDVPSPEPSDIPSPSPEESPFPSPEG